RSSLKMFHSLGDRQYIAMSLEALATVHLLQGDGVRAATLFATADALRNAIAAPIRPADRTEHASWINATRAALGDAGFTTAWAVGRALPPDAALEMALGA